MLLVSNCESCATDESDKDFTSMLVNELRCKILSIDMFREAMGCRENCLTGFSATIAFTLISLEEVATLL